MVIIPKEFNKENKIWIQKEIRRKKDLNAIEKLIFQEICDFVQSAFIYQKKDYCSNTYKELCELLSISETTLTRSLKKLADLNYINIEKISHKNNYRILDNNFTNKNEVTSSYFKNEGNDKKSYQQNDSKLPTKMKCVTNKNEVTSIVENKEPEMLLMRSCDADNNTILFNNKNNTLSKDYLSSNIENSTNDFIYNEEYLRTIIKKLSELSKLPIVRIEQAISMIYSNKIKILAVEYLIYYIIKHKYSGNIFTADNAYSMLNKSLTNILKWNIDDFHKWKKEEDEYNIIESEIERIKRKDRNKYIEYKEKAKKEVLEIMGKSIDLKDNEHRNINETLYRVGVDSYIRTYITQDLKKIGVIRYY